MSDTAVVIAGAGPVGLATAYGLARNGTDVVVIEREPGIGTSPRALAYPYFVLDGFERLGILDELEREGLRSGGMNLVDHETGEQFPSTMEPIRGLVAHPYTLHLGQNQLSRILLDALVDMPNCEIRFDSPLIGLAQDDDGVTVDVGGSGDATTRVTADWLVGADGANSAVRRALDLDFDGFTWPDRFVATNVVYDFEGQGLRTANWRIDPVYGAVIAKITEAGLWRFTFKESADLPVEGVEERIAEHFRTALPGGGPYELVEYAPYRVHQRAAAAFRAGRVLLAGDAAHVTNPTGGQGLTGGFLDSFVLSEALAAVVQGHADASVLDAYAGERRRVFLDIVSPAATRTNKMVFYPPTGPEKVAMLDGIRAARAADAEVRRAELLRMRAVVTPSLVAPGTP